MIAFLFAPAGTVPHERGCAIFFCRAADWNLDEPNWAPIDEYPGICIESVIDSSRYFVVRLKNDSGQTAFIGEWLNSKRLR
uniref:NECAP PHear domain-containing protein n=1 Tax=Parascaris equorum TaxID=6256 RepID=A0A914RSQ6_PAREQ